MDQRLLLMHQVMLGDDTRLRAYDQALAQTIQPGEIVADIGAGTLILSLLALRHGAGHVYAIEADPQMAAIARQIIERNDLKGRLTLIQEDAGTVQLPEKADVLVSEMMGNLGPEEQMADIIGIMARRNLRRGGRIVPARLVTQLQAIQFDDEGWGVWHEDFWSYDLSLVQEYASPTAQLHFFSRVPRLLSASVVVADNQLGAAKLPPQEAHKLKITVQGKLHAVMGYFSATLAPGVTLSNFPSYPGCNWAVYIWPLQHTDVVPGDMIRVAIQQPRQVRVATDWRLDCRIARNKRR